MTDPDVEKKCIAQCKVGTDPDSNVKDSDCFKICVANDFANKWGNWGKYKP